MINPTMFYASIAAVILGFASGWAVRDWKADAAQLKTYQQAEIMREKMQTKVDAIASEYEEYRAAVEPSKITTRNTIREIYKNVEVPAQCAAPDGVVRLLSAATDKANAAASGQSGSALPSAASSATAAN